MYANLMQNMQSTYLRNVDFLTVREDIKRTWSLLFDSYTQNRYVPPDDDWPPYHPKHYTPLTLVHHEGRRTESEVITVAHAVSAQGNVSKSNQSSSDFYDKTVKKFSDLFLPFEGPEPIPYIILIEGAPGIGKTILSKEIALQWANNAVLKYKQLLFLLFMRDPQVKTITDIPSLVKYFCQSEDLTKSITDWLIETSGEHLLIVLDGYDEVSDDNKSHFIHNDIIGRKKLVKCGLVITSRPAASTHLHRRASCRAEVLGFTKKDRKDYIEDALQGIPDRIKQLEGFLKSNPILDSLCYIPLNMTILLCLAEEGVTTLPKTQTELFKKFIIMTILHFRRKEKCKVCATNILSLDDFPPPHAEVIKELSKFAFLALQQDKLVFTLSEIKAACPNVTPDNWYGYGLLKPAQYFNLQDGCEHESLHFVHFSIQEYVAAYYIATLPQVELLGLLKRTFWNFRFINAWIMYVGITGGKDPTFKDFLSGKSYFLGGLFGSSLSNEIKRDKIKCLHLLHCLAEAEHDLLSSVESIFEDGIIDLSHQTMSPHNMRTLAVLLLRSHNKQWRKLDLSYCDLNKTSCDILWEMCCSQNGEIYVNTVDISHNCNLHWNSLISLCTLLRQWHTEELILSVNSLLDSKTSDLVHAFEKKLRQKFYRPIVPLFPGPIKFSNDDKKVWKVIYKEEEHIAIVIKVWEDFSLYQFPFKFVTYKNDIVVFQVTDAMLNDLLFDQMGSDESTHIEFSFITKQYFNRILSTLSNTFLKLKFTGCCVDANYLVDMLDNFSSNINLCKSMQGTYSEKKLECVDAGTIAMNLYNKASSLVTFSFSDCKITTEAADEMAAHFFKNNELTSLRLDNNDLQTEDLVKIGRSLRNMSSLQNLTLFHNNINGEGADVIASLLSHNCKLQELELVKNNLQNEDTIKIVNSLHTTSLVFLTMIGNNIGIEAADSIAVALSRNTKLSLLHLYDNNLQSDGAIKIMKGLRCTTSLVGLYLNDNNIGSDAANDIAFVLSINTQLNGLSLGKNNLQSEGANKIAKGLQYTKSLKSLDMPKNNIGNRAAGDLETALSCLTKLQRLDLSGNQLHGEGIAKIAKGLQHTSSLVQFDMNGNNIGDVAANDIATVYPTT